MALLPEIAEFEITHRAPINMAQMQLMMAPPEHPARRVVARSPARADGFAEAEHARAARDPARR
ncbi:MAG: hypothetical protein ACK4KW_03100 [Gemmobacter sp.]